MSLCVVITVILRNNRQISTSRAFILPSWAPSPQPLGPATGQPADSEPFHSTCRQGPPGLPSPPGPHTPTPPYAQWRPNELRHTYKSDPPSPQIPYQAPPAPRPPPPLGPSSSSSATRNLQPGSRLVCCVGGRRLSVFCVICIKLRNLRNL